MIGQLINLVMYTLIFLVGPIVFLSYQGRASEIYIIWYINSFFFLLFYAVGLFAEAKGVSLLSVCASYKGACEYVYAMLTDADEEMILMLILFGLALGPQVLAYFLSGWSGSAYAPSYLSEITSIVMWSIIKFTAGLAGILVAAWFAKLTLWLAQLTPWFAKLTLIHPVTFDEFKTAYRWLPMSFFFAAMHLLYTKEIPALTREEARRFPRFRTIHRFFTRNVPPEPPRHPHSWRRRALIAMLESDAVYDYVTQDRRNTETVNEPEHPQGNNGAPE